MPDLYSSPSVFGNVHLGYVVIDTQKFGEWRRFGKEAIGMHLDELDATTMRFRLDDRQCRFLVQRGSAEDVTAIGWHLDDHEAFDRIVARVTQHGVPVTEGTAEEAALRGVERLLRFPGPKGLTQEIFTTATIDPTPLRMHTREFVTGAAGMGHVALTSTKPSLLRGYYNTVFDARLSDYIDESFGGIKLRIRFLRVNERHHSVAIASVQQLPVDFSRTRVQHLNIQVAEVDDMLQSFERVTELGFGMRMTVGQHTNDRELSYYAKTPSGFDWEVGWNPITVDESTWEPNGHKGISTWGHTMVGDSVIEKFQMFRQSMKSLKQDEDTVPQLCGVGVPDS
ncbi:VOC family protein [Antrihabitans sp. YC2-6]|uniref:VOC family protein n=1 Tax=Antrihabitans sp. YC2-6 TaxID=2799498 RepID=UPI0018F72BD5|nr:VOC family protein [Antrihabitans sp. YC2-6]MBJ8347242.1 VOC family protein [Antrihabitans sp. YC2-6]